jgi:hypothetical protein
LQRRFFDYRGTKGTFARDGTAVVFVQQEAQKKERKGKGHQNRSRAELIL